MLLRGLTYLTIALTFVMILLGAVVHGTGSSLACPDWPTCYGEAFPAMVGGVLYEHSHRMLGTLIGLSVIAINVVTARAHLPSGRVRSLWFGSLAMIFVQGLLMGAGISTKNVALIAVGTAWGVVLVPLLRVLWQADDNRAAWSLLLLEIVIIQGLLGGLTVVMRLPVMVSSAHLALSLGFLALLVLFALRLQPEARRDGAALMSRRAVGVVMGLTLVQATLGALVKHTGSSLACGADLFLCNGALAPQGGPAHLHFTHRLFAYVVAAAVIAVTLPVMRAARQARRGPARALAIAAHAILLVQIALGLLTVHSYISMPLAVAHLGGGALLFADLVALFGLMGPLGDRAHVRGVTGSVGATAASAVG